MVKLSVPNDDYSLLHQMSSQELRLPDQMIRWLIRQEALRRGLASNNGSNVLNMNNGDAPTSYGQRVAISA